MSYFGHLRRVDFLQPNKTQEDFMTIVFNAAGDNNDDKASRFFAFDIGFQKLYSSAQPINVNSKFKDKVPAGTNGYAIIVTIKLLSIGGDCRKDCDKKLKKSFLMINKFFCLYRLCRQTPR